MSSPEEPTEPEPRLGIDPGASRLIFLGMLGLVASAAVAYNLLKPPPAPPPAEIARDPLLVQGRTIYLARCLSCHGESGRGDGAIAKNLPGPPVGNFTDATWKHGDQPEQVVAVIAKGAPNSAMSPWAGILDPPELKAVAAYVFHLAGKSIPDALRKP